MASTEWIKTESELEQFVSESDDLKAIEPSELHRLYEIVYGHAPTDSEIKYGQVWDLICSGVGI